VISLDLSGRSGLVLGVANKRSLAWAIATRLSQAGMRLTLTYQGDRLKETVEELAHQLPGSAVRACDVTDDSQLATLFAGLREDMPRLDALVHSIAFAQREDLEGHYRDTTREGWRVALEVSAYSLVAAMRHATPLMAAEDAPAVIGSHAPTGSTRPGGSVIALSYMAAERPVPNYNVMGSAKAALEHAVRQLAYELGPAGIRVNAISAGPISTLSARGVSHFTDMLKHHREKACLRRNVTAAEVADSALFLLSDLGSGVTGETLHVDAGYTIVGW
jgi:enoyl-[acyl-carrier protein] reductase I